MNDFFEEIAGFPPYSRGFSAMGNLLQTPEPLPIFIYEKERFQNFKNNENTHFLFKNLSDSYAVNSEKKSILLMDFQLEDKSQLADFQYIYIYFELFLQDDFSSFFDKLGFSEKKFFTKLSIFFPFNMFVFQSIETIRKLRNKSAELISIQKIPSFIPISCYIKTITEQIYALSAQTDFILYDADNEQLSNITNAIIVENTRITKTIDPFFGS